MLRTRSIGRRKSRRGKSDVGKVSEKNKMTQKMTQNGTKDGTKELDESQLLILRLIEENGTITTRDLTQKTGMSQTQEC